MPSQIGMKRHDEIKCSLFNIGLSIISHGVHSSVWLERQVVALEVVGSSPTGHPQKIADFELLISDYSLSVRNLNILNPKNKFAPIV